MYIQHLANSHANVTSVKNYLSGAKHYVRQAGGHLHNFESPLLVNLIKGVARLSSHVPTSAPALDRDLLCRAADALLRLGPLGVVAHGALLFAVATFLRQSNFVLGTGGTTHHLLRRRALTFTGQGLEVVVRSTKTIWEARDAVVIPVAAAPGSPYCPVAACRAALDAAPAPPDAPIFIHPATGRPVTGLILISLLRGVLRGLNYPAWREVTLHSLRHTGARLAQLSGATLPEIMDHGTWSSSAVARYLPRRAKSSLPTRVAHCLANGPKD